MRLRKIFGRKAIKGEKTFGSIEPYDPTIEEIVKDVGVDTVDHVVPAVFSRLSSIYNIAKGRGDVRRFDESTYEFILWDSSDFYKTFVNSGYGNTALTIMSPLSQKIYFLLFKDRVPEDFYPMLVAHESTEIDEIKNHVPQHIAHYRASRNEMKRAEELGIQQTYLSFIMDRYPGRYYELKMMKLI